MLSAFQRFLFIPPSITSNWGPVRSQIRTSNWFYTYPIGITGLNYDRRGSHGDPRTEFASKISGGSRFGGAGALSIEVDGANRALAFLAPIQGGGKNVIRSLEPTGFAYIGSSSRSYRLELRSVYRRSDHSQSSVGLRTHNPGPRFTPEPSLILSGPMVYPVPWEGLFIPSLAR